MHTYRKQIKKSKGNKSWQGDFSSQHNSVHSYFGHIIMNTKYNTILKKNDNICLHNFNLQFNPHFLHILSCIHNSCSGFYYKASAKIEIAIYFLDLQNKIEISEVCFCPHLL